MSEEQEDQANSSSSEKIQLHKRNSSNSNISNLRWSNSWEDFTKYATQPYHEHPSLDGSSCGGNAFRSFLNSFIIAYGLRTSLSIILRAFELLRKNPYALLSLQQLVSEKNLTAREDAVRLGLSFGVFTGAFNLLYCFLRRYRQKEDGWNSFLSGTIAGLSILFQEKDSRRTPALYILARVIQCLYNGAKKRGWWHFWGSNWNYGDSLLFILTSAQVMYAYVMRPETLPPSYYKFIVRTGPIHEVVLQSVRDNCRGKPINLPAVLDYCAKHNGGAPAPLDTLYPSIIPCSVLHPDNVSCFKADLKVFIQSAKRIFPLYATLTFLPVIAFSLNKLVRSPVSVITQGLLSTVRSVAFLASFVSLYQVVICLHRKLIPKDHKFVYFFAGIISSLSILIEKKSRRSELALYTMPRGLDSLYMLLCDRKWLAGFPNGEVLIFSLSIGGLMYFFHNEPEAMSPIFHWVIKTLFRKRLL